MYVLVHLDHHTCTTRAMSDRTVFALLLLIFAVFRGAGSFFSNSLEPFSSE